ncbi:MAG: Helix-turn-helix domain [Miltoncostaeaceae bacterium]|jgi:transcriptional regulator with XRE-family HTH domain|nr:Helix-turn-helix domain [Miltoncostaeaceae bacterium]
MVGLAETLRVARLTAGLTQRQVADALAVPHTYPSRWERGVSRPAPANLLALAELFRLDPGVLLRLYAGPSSSRGAPPAAGGATAAREDAAAAEALARALTEAASATAARPRRRRRASGPPDIPPAEPGNVDR